MFAEMDLPIRVSIMLCNRSTKNFLYRLVFTHPQISTFTEYQLYLRLKGVMRYNER